MSDHFGTLYIKGLKWAWYYRQGNVVLEVNYGCSFIFCLLWHFITKHDCYFITKCDKKLLQDTFAFLLQNVTVLLQNATAITKFDVYFKIYQYKQFFL